MFDTIPLQCEYNVTNISAVSPTLFVTVCRVLLARVSQRGRRSGRAHGRSPLQHGLSTRSSLLGRLLCSVTAVWFSLNLPLMVVHRSRSRRTELGCNHAIRSARLSYLCPFTTTITTTAAAMNIYIVFSPHSANLVLL